MVVGLAWGVCAVLCFANLKNVEPTKKPQAIVLCAFFGVFGICGILGGIFRSPFLWATGTLLPVAILCLFAFVMAIWNQKSCKTRLNGMYLGYRTLKGRRKMNRTYAPVFKYYFCGREYQRQAYEMYSLKKINERFRQGQSYPIWINEKVPDAFITRKGLDGKMFVVLFAGLLVLFFYFLVILALIVVKMAPELGIHF